MSKEFFEAIRAGDRDKVCALLTIDAGLLTAIDENGRDAFIAAKYAGRNEIAALLLEKGVELDLFAACMAGAGMPSASWSTSATVGGWTRSTILAPFNRSVRLDAIIAPAAVKRSSG
jgi:ankyrin repeat protein